MRSFLSRWDGTDRIIITNASSIVGTTAVASGFGFIYWWLAAHLFPPAVVGLAAAAISAMMLLGAVGALGLGTLVMSELPRQPGKELPLITTMLIVAGPVGGGLGVLFAIVAPCISPDLRPLGESFGAAVLFAVGVAFTAVTLVLDDALLGLLRGGLQLGRNTLFAVVKLGALLVAGIWLTDRSGLTVYATWVVGNLVSLVGLAGLAALRGVRMGACRPQWGLLRGLERAALAHHALNLALQAPGLALPVVVTALLSAALGAHFYVAWMIAGFVFVGSAALTTVLYAVGVADPTALAQKIRFTLGLTMVIGLLANGILLVNASRVLSLFGHAYAEQAAWSLRILGLGVFPLSIKHHYVAICRVLGRVTRAARFVAAGATLELVIAAIGASIGGLAGFSLGWVAAVSVEAAFMVRAVVRVATTADTPAWQQTSEVSVLPLIREGAPAPGKSMDG